MEYIDYTTDIGKVRLLIPDVEPLVDPRNVSAEPQLLFTDVQLQALLDVESGNLKRAASRAVMAIATTEALVLKVLTTDDKATDGAKLAAELRHHAEQLRAEAQYEDNNATGFSFVPFNDVPEDHAWR